MGDETVEFTAVQRVSSFHANFETNLESKHQSSRHSKRSASSKPLHHIVHIQAEESELPDDDNDVNLLKLARSRSTRQSNENNRKGDNECPVSPPPRTSSMPQSPCSPGAIGEDGPLSPFSIMENMQWFSNNDDPNGTCTQNNKLLLPTDAELSQKNNKDDDDDSVKSAAYFDPMDFDTSYWIKASMHVPTVGLALLAVTTAIAHPLLFIVGAITAYGTATAALKGYNYIQSDNDDSISIWQRVCSDSNVPDPCNNHRYTLEKNDAKIAPIADDVVVLDKYADIIYGESESDLSSEEKEKEDKCAINLQQPVRKPFLDRSITDASQLTGPDNNVEVSKEWIDLHYPALSETVVKDASFAGLNCLEFFNVFFDDDAPYNFKVFQEKRGDINIHYGNWNHLPESEPLSFAQNKQGSSPFPNGLEYHCFQGRILTFKARTNSFLGPPWASTKKTQRFLIFSKRLAILESRTDLSEIPYCDRFFVVERWVITSEKKIDRYITHITASCGVYFTASCPFESQIRTKSTGTIRDIVNGWCVMATEALKLTERAKLERLNRSLNESTDDIDCDIENKTNGQQQTMLRRVCSDDAIEVTDLSESHHRRALIVGEENAPIGLNDEDRSSTTSTLDDIANTVDSILSAKRIRSKVWTNFRISILPSRSNHQRQASDGPTVVDQKM